MERRRDGWMGSSRLTYSISDGALDWDEAGSSGLLARLIEPGPELEEDLGEGWGGKMCQVPGKQGRLGVDHP
jgi:hypothetical protein